MCVFRHHTHIPHIPNRPATRQRQPTRTARCHGGLLRRLWPRDERHRLPGPQLLQLLGLRLPRPARLGLLLLLEGRRHQERMAERHEHGGQEEHESARHGCGGLKMSVCVVLERA